MPALLNTIEISRMAFEWGGTTRIYRTDRLTVSAEEDGEEWKYANKSWGQVIDAVWLFFQIESNYLQRVSPVSDTDNDWLDVKNAIIDSATTVTFYPIYSVDQAISYPVISNAIGSKQKLLETDRAIYKPQVAMNIKPADSLNQYPDWLKITRQKS